VALKSGISLTPYDFRHIFATTYIRNGGDAFTLQRIMGHTKPSMTMVYVNLNADDLSIAHKKINPLSNFISRRISKIK
jgi:site-specific recombinase XerD